MRSRENGLEQLGPLPVREMPVVAQVPLDQELGPAAMTSASHVVIEFDAEHVDVGQALGHGCRPAARVGEVADLTGGSRRSDDASIRNPNVGPPSCRSSIGSSRSPVEVKNG